MDATTVLGKMLGDLVFVVITSAVTLGIRAALGFEVAVIVLMAYGVCVLAGVRVKRN